MKKITFLLQFCYKYIKKKYRFLRLFQTKINKPLTNITAAKMRFNKLLKVSFILENGINIITIAHTKATIIIIQGV